MQEEEGGNKEPDGVIRGDPAYRDDRSPAEVGERKQTYKGGGPATLEDLEPDHDFDVDGRDRLLQGERLFVGSTPRLLRASSIPRDQASRGEFKHSYSHYNGSEEIGSITRRGGIEWNTLPLMGRKRKRSQGVIINAFFGTDVPSSQYSRHRTVIQLRV